MLSLEEIKQIKSIFKLHFRPENIKRMEGGDVNSTYLAEDDQKKYVIKKIDIGCHIKAYGASKDEIINSLNFSENIAQQLLPTNHVISALFSKENCVLETQDSLITIYPYIAAKIKENKVISSNNVQSIANYLHRLHQSRLSFNTDFAETKTKIYQQIGHSVINNSFWRVVSRMTNKSFLFPKFHRLANYLLSNKECFNSAIQNMKHHTICHNDLKPKNVLWDAQGNFWVIDWESVGLFDASSDYLDTLLAWCTVYHKNSISLDKAKLKVSGQPHECSKNTI